MHKPPSSGKKPAAKPKISKSPEEKNERALDFPRIEESKFSACAQLESDSSPPKLLGFIDYSEIAAGLTGYARIVEFQIVEGHDGPLEKVLTSDQNLQI